MLCDVTRNYPKLYMLIDIYKEKSFFYMHEKTTGLAPWSFTHGIFVAYVPNGSISHKNLPTGKAGLHT